MSMTLATELIQQYRFALRDLWNTYFWGDKSDRDWESLKVFNELKLPLFTALVATRLQSYVAPPHEIFGEAFRVVPPQGGHNCQVFREPLYLDVGFPDRPGECWERLVGRCSSRATARCCVRRNPTVRRPTRS